MNYCSTVKNYSYSIKVSISTHSKNNFPAFQRHMADDVEDMSLYSSRNPALYSHAWVYVYTYAMQSRLNWGYKAYTTFSNKWPVAIVFQFHCDLTPFPFKMVSWFNFICLFYLHMLKSKTDLSVWTSVKRLSVRHQGWMQQGDAGLSGNTNLLILYIYSIQVSISNTIRMGHVTSVFVCCLIVDDRKEK